MKKSIIKLSRYIIISITSIGLIIGIAIVGWDYYDNNTPVTIRIDTTKTYQEIEGFGASGAWWAQNVGGWDELDEIMDYLFDKEKGIGLTIYRYNIGAGPKHKLTDPWRGAETFEIAPGEYDWTRDAEAVHVMREAVNRGVEEVVMFTNSPPGRMTLNGYTTGDFDGNENFKDGMEEEFAKYLVDIAEHFKSEGIPVSYISPINEPQWDWNSSQEGCHYSPEQIINVSRALVNELEARDSDIKISLVESGKWTDKKYTMNLYDQLIGDPIIGPAMDHFSGHSYWTNTNDKKKVAKIYSKKDVQLPIHMTEWCQMESGRDLGMDAALVLAKTVHDDLTILNAVNWQQWLAVSPYDYKDGLVYVDKDTHKVYDSKRMWALGNWSKFLERGDIRIDIETSRNTIQSTGFINEDGHLILVIVNPKQEKEIILENLNYTTVIQYETSNTHSLEQVYSGEVKSNIILPEGSITTLIYK